MRYIALIIFLFPSVAFASCFSNGATVVYVNGIFTSENQARSDATALWRKYFQVTGDDTVKIINGYNPSHLAGLGDLVQSAAQIMGRSISNFDRDTILLQIYPQVTTRKLILVGHSQGAFYSNALYDYLLAHGEPKAAVGVYQVGSPASSVAGGGKYLNSSGDTMLGMLRGLGFTFLPSNIDLVSTPDDATKNYPGHSFSSAYLAAAPERIVGDIQSEIGALAPDAATNTGDCFTPPAQGVGYEATRAAFAVADTAATGVKAGAGAVQTAAVAAGNVLAAALQGAYGITAKVVSDIGITAGGITGITHAAEPAKTPTNFDILSKLYGSSVSKEEYKDLLGNLGSAVATAPVFATVPAPAAVPAPATDTPAPQKITYLSGSHHSRDTAQEVEDTTINTEVAPVPPEIVEPAVTTEEARAPEEPAPETASTSPHTVPALSPVADSFDSYNGSGWNTYGGYNMFGADPGVRRYFATTSDECHAGGCLSGSTEIGNGGYGNPVRMYKTGTPVNEGSLIIWKKYHVASQGAGNVWVQVCVGAPDGGHCDGLINGLIGGTPDVWHEYYLAWRDNGDTKEICGLRDDTDQSHCTWQASGALMAGEAPDTVVISGDAVRPDLGDRIWFDDLGTP